MVIVSVVRSGLFYTPGIPRISYYQAAERSLIKGEDIMGIIVLAESV